MTGDKEAYNKGRCEQRIRTLNVYIEGMIDILKGQGIRDETKIRNTITQLEVMKESNEELLKEVA
jgi:hypothetical protein